MKKQWLWLISLGLIIILAAPVLTGCQTPTAAQGTSSSIQISQQQQGFWVSGTGEITVTPNLAVLWLGVESQQTSVADALSRTSEGMNKVMQSLANSRIDLKDIQTGSFNINQRTRWNEPEQTNKITGYIVTNMVTVKIRDVNKVGQIIDAAVQAGGDLIRINNLNFSVEEPSEYYKEAREKAIANARAKAEQYAGLTGVKLGKPTYVSEGAQQSNANMVGNYYAGNMSLAAESASGASISPGQNKIVLSVTVAYEIIK
jgi:uncharacterized protein